VNILPRLVIGSLKPRFPIIQGGMAIRVSTGRLAGAVAREGGIGLIAGSGMSQDEVRAEIRLARTLAQGGIVGINTLVAASAFLEVMKTAIDEGIDLLVAGAGFSRELFAIGRRAGVPVVPVVSSPRLAYLAESLGAAAVIAEGKEAGGHLGTAESSRVIYPAIKAVVKIPAIMAGGITDRADVLEAFAMKVDGIQVGTRFAASCEANVSVEFHQRYVQAGPGDVFLIQSPVGLPGNALPTPFSDRISRKEPLTEPCNGCLKKCSHSFCIVRALSAAREGNMQEGLVFAGEHVHKIREILSVSEIFSRFFAGLSPLHP
jgi:NAD(P)H-dependent flavin oxidoreductase YrpB (nitropropane dioxygenase family)